jgi:hypothetical protein
LGSVLEHMRASAIVLSLLLLYGCIASTVDSTTTSSVPDSTVTSSPGGVDGPVLTSPRPELTSTRTSYSAEVSGTVTYDSEKNCLYLADGEVRWVVVWPGGTEWRSDSPGVRLPNGEIAEPGMRVRGGGGWFDLDFVRGIAGPEVAEAAAACGGPAAQVAVYNIGEAAELQVVQD